MIEFMRNQAATEDNAYLTHSFKRLSLFQDWDVLLKKMFLSSHDVNDIVAVLVMGIHTACSAQWPLLL